MLAVIPAESRKVAIAATLTMNPRLVILDEPTNNLDEDEIHHLMRHLQQLRDSGTTVVVITHDVEVACTYSDRVMVMSQGQILLHGPTRRVMQQQATPATKVYQDQKAEPRLAFEPLHGYPFAKRPSKSVAGSPPRAYPARAGCPGPS